MTTKGQIPHETMEAAADWCDRLDELSVQECAELHTWLNASRENARAFDMVRSTMLDVALLDSTAQLFPQSAGARRLVASPVKWVRGLFGSRTPWLVLSGAAAIVCAVLLVRPNAPQITPAPSTQLVLVTAIGQRSDAKLADNSEVFLNADTRLTVRYLAHTRQLSLSRGEAIFEVAKDAKRPFQVFARAVTVTAVGTRFGVDLVDKAVEVRVFEGTVRVAGRGASTRAVSRGHWLIIDPVHGITNGEFLPDHYPNWRTGWLEADGMPLSHVVERLNRYTVDKIVLQDKALSDVALTGRFRLDNTDRTLSQLAALLNVEVKRQDHRILLAHRHE